jgi:hypothetical protein
MPLLFHAAYGVEPGPEGWAVTFQGRPHARYPTRRQALRHAARDAAFCRHLGHDVSLAVRSLAGRIRNIRVPPWDSFAYEPGEQDGERR